MFKLAIFNNICNRADIPFKDYMKQFSTILKSFLLNYQYLDINITNLLINFD